MFIVFVFCMVAVLMAATFTVGALAAFRIGRGLRPFDLSTVQVLIGAYVLGVVGVLMYVQQAEDPAVMPMVITVLFVVVSVVFTLRILRNLRVHARMKSEISRQEVSYRSGTTNENISESALKRAKETKEAYEWLNKEGEENNVS